jgi:hypothetical protein
MTIDIAEPAGNGSDSRIRSLPAEAAKWAGRWEFTVTFVAFMESCKSSVNV